MTTESPGRAPITDVAAWLGKQGSLRRDLIAAIGELFTGVTAVDADGAAESDTSFTARALGITSVFGHTVVEERELTSVSAVTTAMALSALITSHSAAVGPGRNTETPSWTTTRIANESYRHPLLLRAAFPAGTLDPDAAVVVSIDARPNYGRPHVTATVMADKQHVAVTVLDALDEAATALSPFRGRICRATSAGIGLTLSVLDPPESLSRETLIQADSVWRELDLSIAAVATRHQQLADAGISARRGVMLCGKPGVGKSQLCLLACKELVAVGFTAFILDASAGERLLTAVVEEAAALAPAVVCIEDVDLFVRSRSVPGNGLSELLGACDIRQDARILLLASTNDASTLDAAALRTGRFSSHIQIDPPTTEMAARILTQVIAGLPGGAAGVDTAAVAAVLPADTTPSDLVEIATRASLGSADGTVTTQALIAEVGAGRYREVLTGAYL